MSTNRKRNRIIRVSDSVWEALAPEVERTGCSRSDLAEKLIQEGILSNRQSILNQMAFISNLFNELIFKLKFNNEAITVEDLEALEREVMRIW